MEGVTEEQRKYLNALRRSGVVNMYGSVRFLEEGFDLPRPEAQRVLAAWMKGFDSTVDG